MKIKKIILGAVLSLACVFTLVSCNDEKELTYVDKDGNTQTQLLKATEDKEEVKKDVVALCLQDYKVDQSQSVRLTAKAKYEGKQTEGEKTTNFEANANLVVEEKSPEYKEGTTQEDYLKATELYLMMQADATLPNGLISGKLTGENQKVNAKLESYLDSGLFYVKTSELDLDLAKLYGDTSGTSFAIYLPMINGIITSLKGNTYKLDFEAAKSMAQMALGMASINVELPEDIDYQNISTLNLAKINEILKSAGFEKEITKEDIYELAGKIVDELGLTVKKVDGDKVTFGINYVKENEVSATAELTIDISNLHMISAKAEATILRNNESKKLENKITCELNFEYGVKVTKIAEEDKTKAKDIQELFSGLLGGLGF